MEGRLKKIILLLIAAADIAMCMVKVERHGSRKESTSIDTSTGIDISTCIDGSTGIDISTCIDGSTGIDESTINDAYSDSGTEVKYGMPAAIQEIIGIGAGINITECVHFSAWDYLGKSNSDAREKYGSYDTVIVKKFAQEEYKESSYEISIVDRRVIISISGMNFETEDVFIQEIFNDELLKTEPFNKENESDTNGTAAQGEAASGTNGTAAQGEGISGTDGTAAQGESETGTEGQEEVPKRPLESYTVECIQNKETGLYDLEIILNFNKAYVYDIMEDEDYYYIGLVRAKDLYDKIVVIDAGHGGRDPGTSSEGSKYLEKDINLSIMLYLKEYLEADENIQVFCTRTTDVKPSLSQRVDMANDLEADLFLSIHCNAAENKVLNGTEVLYNEYQNDWEGFNSKQFALICQQEAVKVLGLKDMGISARGHNVHIVGNANMPVALVETGFMSHETDLKVIIDKNIQKKTAEALYKAILRAFECLDGQAAE